MELLIRSQNKNRLVKVDDLYSDNFSGDGWYRIYSMPNEEELGKYLTKERALEILDEIQSLFGPFSSIQIPYSKKSLKLQELSTYVYKMPEK